MSTVNPIPGPDPQGRPPFRILGAPRVNAEADAETIAEMLALFIEPGQHIEVGELLTDKRYIAHHYDSIQTAAVRIAASDPRVVSKYFALNPYDASRLYADMTDKRAQRVCNHHITRRRWLLIDCDRAKMEGTVDLSSTDEEKAESLRLALAVREGLRAEGWPDPVLADSGNGWHLLYRIDLPNDAAAAELVRGVLAELADRFNTDQAEVDTVVYNAGRVTKAYGTMTRKGPESHDRCHRASRLVDVPETLEPVPRALLESLAPKPVVTPTPPPKGDQRSSSRRSRLSPEERAVLYLAECEPAISGAKGHSKAFKAACNFGPGFDLPEEVAIRLFTEHYNPRCQPHWSEKEIRHKITQAYSKESARGWLLKEDRRSDGATGNRYSAPGPASADVAEDGPPRDLVLTSMSDMKATPIEWLAPGRIPLGKLVLLAGPGGLGKSTLTLDLASRLSRGLPLFDDQADDVSDVEGPAEAMLVAAEDDAADTQLPRVLAAKGDVSKIHCVQGIRGTDGSIQPFSVADIDPIHQTLLKRPNIRLIIIDPIASYIGRAKVDDHRNSELSAILAPLNQLAATHRVTILMIAHFNKSTSATAVNRIMGGAAYTNSVRAALAVVPDPEDESKRIVDSVKSNLAQKPKALAYRIGSLDPDELMTIMDHQAFSDLNEKQKNRMSRQLAKIHWEGTVETSADECLGGSAKRGAPSKKADAILWLHKYLAEHGPKTKDQAIEAAKGSHGKNAIWEAWSHLRTEHGAKPIPVEDENGKTVWYWPRLAPPAGDSRD